MMLKRQENETTEFQSTVTFVGGHLNVKQQHQDPNDHSEIAPANTTEISEPSGNNGL